MSAIACSIDGTPNLSGRCLIEDGRKATGLVSAGISFPARTETVDSLCS